MIEPLDGFDSNPDDYALDPLPDLILRKDDCSVLSLNEMFKDKECMLQVIHKYALKSNIEYKVLRSSKSRYAIKCLRNNCSWRLNASKVKATKAFKITFVGQHQCSYALRGVDHKQATSRVIGDMIMERIGAHVAYTPKAIICDMLKVHGVKISYMKAWKARELAINRMRGSFEQSYEVLPTYCQELEKTNPGIVTKILREGSRFKRVFVALGQCIQAVQSNKLRPVIAIDGSHLKGNYRSTLFTSTTLDGDNHIFPIAIGVGESENNVSWHWFLNELSNALGPIENLVIISDQHASILTEVKRAFPDAWHGYCVYHIAQNMYVKFKDPRMYQYLYAAAKSYKASDYAQIMNALRDMDKDAFDWLSDIEAAS